MKSDLIDLVIFGAGGHAREMCDLVSAINQLKPTYNLLGFLDQSTHIQTQSDLLRLGDHSWLCSHPDVHVVIAIGSTATRYRVSKLIRSVCGNAFQTLIHPTAHIGQGCQIGVGSMIAAGVVLTCGVFLGEHTLVNVRASLSHEARTEDFVTIAPNATICGAVNIAVGCDIGASATIIQQCKIGRWSIVGAGAVIISDVEDNVTVVGNPARLIAKREPDWQNP